MQAKKRYLLLVLCGVSVILCYILIPLLATYREDGSQSWHSDDLEFGGKSRRYLDAEDSHDDTNLQTFSRFQRATKTTGFRRRECRMETCFDFGRCSKGFKIYVYPTTEQVSVHYVKILNSLRDSRYYTTDPDEACIFFLAIDTTDRDTLSPSYVKNIPDKIAKLSHWNEGRNHVIFNLYSGTWPDYVQDQDFDIGYAILAKASISVQIFRPGFDISFPLFHKELAAKGVEKGTLGSLAVPPNTQYTLAFKGKRYLTGIGSESRNSLYHLHNGKDMILLTTCKHGKGWKVLQDERCPHDNEIYDKYDYKVLLNNSTFCLVPRGRRLGSFRFIEVLQAGCIPVLLANGWELPFSDVIDWNKAVVWGDERLLLQVPSIVHSISDADILAFRQQTQFLWETYFSSVDSMVQTVLEILKERVVQHSARTSVIWNSTPGAFSIQTDFSENLSDFPFYNNINQHRLSHSMVLPPMLPLATGGNFTAIVYVTNCVVLGSSPVSKLLKNLVKSSFLAKIIVLWNCDGPPPVRSKWPVIPKVPMIIKSVKTISARFHPWEEISNQAVLNLDEDVMLTTDEIDFAFVVWQHFPERIVGYPARNHFWDEPRSKWGYTSKWTNEYSMVLTGAAFYHRYYNYLYTTTLHPLMKKTVDQCQNCEDILMNFLVSHVTKLPPIKVTQRKQYKETMLPSNNISKQSTWLEADHFSQRQACINTFVTIFGYMPLVRSNTRLDPVLFKDPVSNLRKKYRQMEVL
ncbi:exostosin-1a isoform X1 [Lingula anatina]|uniref:Exostosin-1a isoform X1 n=1 Tax=Lingula anatina TaxID=7574 RepID=A0A1S3JTH4_LINAN|nr:exostosin-1a isoform X2 [Lingula anatina]XP_013413642.1 exostosin-1a isoform X1 [Lingula anatina]|eukprot:XP_013413641.1 exostosin-1a isoform X2 [Lingula anatina]